MLKLTNYYNLYWQTRGFGHNPIPDVPKALKQYTYYGAILSAIRPNSKILDLGCGDGSVSQIYLQKGEVTGIDISSHALKQAKKNGLTTTIKHDLNQTPYPLKPSSYDYVIATDVIEHLFNPIAFLAEARRLLKQHGKIIIAVPNFARLQNRIRMIYGDPIDILHWSKYGDEIEHLHWFTQPKLNHLLNEAGFKKNFYLPAGLRGNFILVKLGFPNLSSFLVVQASK